MFYLLSALLRFIIALFIPDSLNHLFTHYVILQKEVEILKRTQKTKTPIQTLDRLFLSIISAISDKGHHLLSIIKPETLLKWQKRLIRRFWTFDNTPKKPGRPPTPQHVKSLILDMKNNNLTWGAPRIEDELLKLGIKIDHSTISRILQEYRKQGKIRCGLSWKTFLTMQAKHIFAMDFFTIDTIFNMRLHVFFIIHHETRQIIQFAMTRHPTIVFVKQQLIDFEETIVSSLNHAAYMIYDNGCQFNFDLLDYGLIPVRTAIRAPNMNSIAERLVGSIRREALDYFLIFNEIQAMNIIREYVQYYNSLRPHQGIKGIPKGYEPQKNGEIKSRPILGGLHHHYFREAA